jgi:hypothetical protein
MISLSEPQERVIHQATSEPEWPPRCCGGQSGCPRPPRVALPGDVRGTGHRRALRPTPRSRGHRPLRPASRCPLRNAGDRLVKERQGFRGGGNQIEQECREGGLATVDSGRRAGPRSGRRRPRFECRYPDRAPSQGGAAPHRRAPGARESSCALGTSASRPLQLAGRIILSPARCSPAATPPLSRSPAPMPMPWVPGGLADKRGQQFV